MKTCTIKREGDAWYVVFACEVKADPLSENHEAVGIDLGLLHFATLSDGSTIENPRRFRKAEKKLARLQQTLARKKRGSHRRKKAVKQVAKAHRKVRNQRRDFLHKQSRKLVNTYGMMVFEELQPANMSKRPKPQTGRRRGVFAQRRGCQGRVKQVHTRCWLGAIPTVLCLQG
jgi:putative transposase